MKIKSKRFLISFLLMFALIISVFAMTPLTASAATATGVVLYDSDGTNPVGLNSGSGCYLVNGESANSGTLGENGCTAYFDPSTGTLTLNGYNGGSIYVSDYTNNDLTIKLIGTNSITTTMQSGVQTQNGDLVVTSDDAGSLTVNVSGTESVKALSSGYGNQVKGSVILSGNANVTVNVANNSLNDYSYGIYARKAIEINDSATFTANMSGTTTSNDKNAGLYIESGNEGTITINTTGNVVIDTTATAANYTKPVNNATNSEGSLILTKVGTMTLKYKVWNGYESECTPSKWTYAENSFARRQEKDNSITTVTYKYGTPYTVKVSNGKYDNGEEVYASEYQYVTGETATIVAPSLDCGFAFKSWTSSAVLNFVEETSATNSTAKITVGESDIIVFANYTAFSTQPTFVTTGVIENTTTPVGKIDYAIAGGVSPSYTYIVPTTGFVYGYGGDQCDVIFNSLEPNTEFVENFNWPYNELNSGSYRIAIEVEDIWFYSDVFTVSYELDLTFNDNNNFDIVAGQVNKQINEIDVSGAVYGGVAPYTFSKESGPEWLNVSAEGIITGTRPALVQDATTATIKVTDNAGTTRTIAIAIGAVTAAPTYQVSFDKDGGTGEMASVPVVENGTYELPTCGFTAPTGYEFKCWSVNEVEKDVGEPITITSNTTVKAIWKAKSYTITFDTDGGSAVAPITQDYGTTVTAPNAPTKTGYTFKGWNQAVPSTMPAQNMTITAEWEINQYTITFNTDGGNAIDPITQNYGTAVVAPANPTKDGYTFAGWDKTIPSTMPAENVTITASWNLIPVHEHTDADGQWESDGTYHWHTCSCTEQFDMVACSGGTATCTAKAVCTVCNNEYGNTTDEHSYGAWTSNGDGTHTRVCSLNAEHKENGNCAGGTATCTEKAVCATCNTAYGNTAAHSHGSEWKTDANEHWNECVCGDKANKAAHTDSNNDGKCDTCEYQMSTTPDNPDNPNNTPDNPNNTPDDPSDDKDGLGAGAIVGIVIGSVAVVGIGGFALFWFVIKKKSFADLIAVFKKK